MTWWLDNPDDPVFGDRRATGRVSVGVDLGAADAPPPGGTVALTPPDPPVEFTSLKTGSVTFFKRHDGTTLATLDARVGAMPHHTPHVRYALNFAADATPRERELFAEYLASCFQDAADAVADCVAQGIRGVGR